MPGAGRDERGERRSEIFSPPPVEVGAKTEDCCACVGTRAGLSRALIKEPSDARDLPGNVKLPAWWEQHDDGQSMIECTNMDLERQHDFSPRNSSTPRSALTSQALTSGSVAVLTALSLACFQPSLS